VGAVLGGSCGAFLVRLVVLEWVLAGWGIVGCMICLGSGSYYGSLLRCNWVGRGNGQKGYLSLWAGRRQLFYSPVLAESRI